VVDAALERGLLVNRTADTVVRLLPPFVVTAAEVDDGVALLDQALASVTSPSTGGGQGSTEGRS
jgi:acetylornithine/succinyldiaminopimelate/putrescine aminotransferase